MEETNGPLQDLMNELSSKKDGKVSKELQEAIDALEEASSNQLKALHAAEREGKITTRQQQKATKDVLRNMMELKESVRLAATTQKDATVAIKDSTDIAEKNLKTQEKALKQGRDLLQVERQQVRFSQQSLAQAKNLANKGADFVRQGGRQFGNTVKGAAGRAAGELASSGGFGQMATAGGPIALAAAALLGTATMAFSTRAKGVRASAGRLNNYAATDGGVQGEIAAALAADTTAGRSGTRYGLDPESLKASTRQIATATGSAFKDITVVQDRLARLAFLGVDTVEGLTEAAIKETNRSGDNIIDVVNRMTAKSEMAIGSGLQFDDFSASIRTIGDSLTAMDRSSSGLAKTMRMTAQVANKLGLSYDRTANAAASLTSKLATGDEGFRIMNVEAELKAAVKEARSALKTNPADRSAQRNLLEYTNILSNVQKGLYDPEMAARFGAEAGLGMSEAVLNSRLVTVLENIKAGMSIREATASLGEVDLDVAKILTASVEAMTGGKDIETVSKEMSAEVAKLRADTLKREQEVRQEVEAADPIANIGQTLSEVLVTLTQHVAGPLAAISSGISKLVEFASRPLSKELSDWAGVGFNKRDNELTDFTLPGEKRMSDKLLGLLGGEGEGTTLTTKLQMAAKKGVLQDLRVESDTERRLLETRSLPKELVNALSSATAMERKRSAGGSVGGARIRDAIRREVSVNSIGDIIIPASALQASMEVVAQQRSTTATQ